MEIRVADWSKALVVTALVILSYQLLALIVQVVLLFTAAALLSFFMSPAIDALTSVTNRRTIGILLTYLLLLLGIFLLVALLAPLIEAQVRSSVSNYPQYIRDAQRWFGSLNRLLQGTPLSGVTLEPRALLSRFGGELTGQLRAAVGLIPAVFGALTTTILVFIISLYLSLTLPQMDRSVKGWLREDRLIRLYQRFKDFLRARIGKYFGGIAVLMVSVGAMTAAGLWLIGVPNAMILGVIAGLFEIIPFFGPVLGAIPAVILALTMGVIPAVLTLGLFVLVQFIEGNLLSPVVLGKTVDVAPLGVILLLLIGEGLGGVVGAILAVPVFIVLKSLWQFLEENFDYIREVRGPDRIVLQDEGEERKAA